MKNKVNEKIWFLILILITGISFVRFFYMITGDYFTFIDEYITFDTAAGLTHTGKFYLWDFHKEQLTDQQYIRAWPHTVLLALWFKVFGVNVIAGKILSAIFGILFILSLFYITKKIYEDYFVSILSCVFVLTNTTVVTVFRQIRMYSLWMLVMIWLIYFIYQMLTVEPRYNGSNCLIVFWKNNLNFSVKYIIFTLIFLVLGYFVHMNTLAIGVGMCLFYLYLLVTKRERRYMMALVCIIGLVIIATFLVPWLAKYNADINSIYWNIIVSGHVGVREDVNIRYWHWVLDFVHSRRFFWGTMICMGIAFLRNIRKRNNIYNFSVYCFIVTISTLCCFLYFLSRYYAARYMIYIAPLIAILMAWGIVETFTIIKWRPFLLAGVAVSILFSGVNIWQEFIQVYYNPGICHHREVYRILEEDASNELDNGIIPIAGYDFRDYYGVQILDNYEIATFDRENDMEILKKFAEKYPNGYVLVETAKINGFPEVIKAFIQNYAERIAGEGLDNYNIETVRYHFVNATSNGGKINEENTERKGPITYWYINDGSKTKIYIKLDGLILDDNADTLFLKFGIFTSDKETYDKCYQLRIPEQNKNKEYYYEIIMDKACQVVLLKDECMIYYKNGEYKENLLDEIRRK